MFISRQRAYRHFARGRLGQLPYCVQELTRNFAWSKRNVAGGFGADLGPKSIQAISFLRKSIFWSFLFGSQDYPPICTSHLMEVAVFVAVSLPMSNHGWPWIFVFTSQVALTEELVWKPVAPSKQFESNEIPGTTMTAETEMASLLDSVCFEVQPGSVVRISLAESFFWDCDPGVHLGISWSTMMESDWDIESLDLQLDGEQYIVSGQWIWRWMAGLTRFKNPLSDERNLGFFSSSGCDMVRFIYLPGFGKARAEAWQRQFFHGVKTWAVPNYKSIASNICSTKNHKIIKNPSIWFNFAYWDAIDFFYFIWISFGCDAPSESGQIPQGPAMRVASQSSGNEPWSLVD